MIQLPVNDELVWDNGTSFPEPCIDRIADTVGKVRIFLIMISYDFLFVANLNRLMLLFVFLV